MTEAGDPPADGAELDRQLLAAIQDGCRASLARLYDRHADRMLGYAYRMLNHRGDAEDLLHDVFIEVWQRAGGYDPARGSVAGWLLVRLRSRAIDRLRAVGAARDRGLVDAAPDDCPAPPAGDPSLAPERALARRAVAELSEVQRSAVELGYFEGLTCAEIAARCGVPIGTVKSRLAAALTSLRRTFAAPVTGGVRDVD